MKKIRCALEGNLVKLNEAVAFNGQWYHNACAEWLMKKDRKKKKK